MRLDQARRPPIRESRIWISVYIENVFSLQLVKIAFIREKAVKQEEAQIRDAGFWKRRQTDYALQVQLHILRHSHRSLHIPIRFAIAGRAFIGRLYHIHAGASVPQLFNSMSCKSTRNVDMIGTQCGFIAVVHGAICRFHLFGENFRVE